MPAAVPLTLIVTDPGSSWVPVSKRRQTQIFLPWKITEQLVCQFDIRRILMMSCPWCHSERIHQSKRKGILERGFLTMLFFKPFRCETCDRRFFRWSFTANRNASRTIATY
jgi:hypothetical protein